MANNSRQFVIRRTVRTPHSEAFLLFQDVGEKQPTCLGSFDLHIAGKTYYGTLILEKRLDDKHLEMLLSQIEYQLSEPAGMRADFVLRVYEGKEVGYYSDVVTKEDRRYEPSSKGDLEDISATLARVVGRHQDARGKLNEHALCDYFQSLGYHAGRAGPELDHQKVDVVAENDTERIFAQTKLGSVSHFDMRAIVKSVSELPDVPGKIKVAAIAGAKFPTNCDILRRQLEAQFKTTLLCIQRYQVLQAAPEYRSSLGE